jgi:hypothetical protein
MPSFLIAPGVPYFIAAIGGALLALMGLLLSERRRIAVAGMRLLPTAGGISGRYLVGNAMGLPVATVLVLTAVVGNAQGQTRSLLFAGAFGAYLYLALVIPRRPLVQQQQEARQLRRITPGFISFVRVALGSFESPLDILRRYVARPVPAWAPMQELVQESIRVGLDQRLRPFAALNAVARHRACRELIDVTDALAQAEAEGGSILPVLEAQQATLELILQSEFKRMLRRRTMYLLLMVAISLVVGILINLLFTMTAGGSALFNLGM